MRKTAIALLLLAACDKAPANPPATPPKGPDRTPAATPPASAAPAVDPNSPLQGADLLALGFPKDFILVDFGSNEQAKKFSVHSPTYPLRLSFELHTCASEAEAEEKYKLRRDGRAGAFPDLKDEAQYGKKSYFSTTEIVFVKGAALGVIGAADPEREAKPGELEKLIRAVAGKLSK